MSPRIVISFGLALAAVAAFPRYPTNAQVPEQDLAKELPRIPAAEPGKALATFQIHKGFRLEPFATEPLVTDPVSLVHDADGKVYVVEMRGYPYAEQSATGGVRLLEDVDWDGKADKSTLFLDGLSWPTGIVAHDGGVFISVPPDILYAKDTNGDGKADVRKVAYTGFGTQNVQALVNGLLWGPDGWIYGAGGGNGGEIKNPSRPDLAAVSIRGRDFRFKPDGSAFEAISGGGQFGHSFDDWGHRFVCNNSNHIRQIVLPSHYIERNPALNVSTAVDDIAAEGGAAPVYRISGAEPWRIVRTRQRKADPVISKRLPYTELFAIGFFTSATGVTVYRGSSYPAEYRNDVFIGDVGGNLVHRKHLRRGVAEFVARRADEKVEFLASTDNWFRPVNFSNTPDGTLMLLDMYRETIEHPLSIPEPIKKHLDLTSGKDRGRLYNLVHDGFRRRDRPSLSTASATDLVERLADPDAWWRETAQRLLIERRETAAIPALKRLASKRPTALGRIHALWTLDVLGGSDPGLIAQALTDSEPGVRENAAKLAERFASSSPEIAEKLLGLAEDADGLVRFQAALSIGAVPGPKALNALATIAKKDGGNVWIRSAVLSSLRGRPAEFMEALSSAESPRFLGTSNGRVWLEELSYLVGAENRPEAVRATLGKFVRAGVEPAEARSVVLGLGRGLRRAGGSLRQVEQGGAALRSYFERAAFTAQSKGDSRERLDAVKLLGLGPVDIALKTLPALLDPREPSAVQLSALQALGDLPDPRTASAVVDRWKSLSPAVRGEAAEILFARSERLPALLRGLESGQINPSDLDPTRRKALAEHTDKSLRERATKLLGAVAKSNRGEVIASFRPALSLKGDVNQGRAIFKQTCSTCHRAEGQGTDVGPNLATVQGRTVEDLLVHILDPNRETPPIYLNYTVATTDGRVLTGIIAEESANSVTVKRAEGVVEVVPRDRIEEIKSTGISLMPEGLEKGQTAKSFADLIAYVRNLQANPVPTAPAPNR